MKPPVIQISHEHIQSTFIPDGAIFVCLPDERALPVANIDSVDALLPKTAPVYRKQSRKGRYYVAYVQTSHQLVVPQAGGVEQGCSGRTCDDPKPFETSTRLDLS
jgi:hypothetical protein